MSKEVGFCRYICERPAAKHADGKEVRQYAKEDLSNTSGNKTWHYIEHTFMSAASAEEQTCGYWICDACYKEYAAWRDAMDESFKALMGIGEETV